MRGLEILYSSFLSLGSYFPLRHDLIPPSKWRDRRLNRQQKGVSRTNKRYLLHEGSSTEYTNRPISLPPPRQSGSAVSSLPRAPPLPSAHRPTISLSLAPTFIPLTLLSLLSVSLSLSLSFSSRYRSSSLSGLLLFAVCLSSSFVLFVQLFSVSPVPRITFGLPRYFGVTLVLFSDVVGRWAISVFSCLPVPARYQTIRPSCCCQRHDKHRDIFTGALGPICSRECHSILASVAIS